MSESSHQTEESHALHSGARTHCAVSPLNSRQTFVFELLHLNKVLHMH